MQDDESGFIHEKLPAHVLSKSPQLVAQVLAGRLDILSSRNLLQDAQLTQAEALALLIQKAAQATGAESPAPAAAPTGLPVPAAMPAIPKAMPLPQPVAQAGIDAAPSVPPVEQPAPAPEALPAVHRDCFQTGASRAAAVRTSKSVPLPA